MYKRYLEPDDNGPLTNYMKKKIRSASNDPNSKIVNRKTKSDDVVTDEDIVIRDETQFVNGGIDSTVNGAINVENIDPVSNDEDFFRAIIDQLIHPNLECKTTDAITMILAFFLQHHLTWVALEDLLTLLHSILGDDSNLPKTKYLFKKCFGPNQRTVIHIYCKKCMVYIDTFENLKHSQASKVENDVSPDVCTVCETTYSLKKMNDGHFFMELPLREQIEKKISEDIGILDHKSSSVTGDIADIFDGELYKSLRAKVGPGPLVTLTLNTDGVRVYKSKRKASLWPIQWTINEVPPHKRFKLDNIILSGIWFGSDPCFELYLQPTVKELNDLDERKIIVSAKGTDRAVTVRVLLFSADLPAKSKVLKMKQFNGEFGCSYCLHPGFMVGSSTSSKYTVSTEEEYSLRSHSGTLSLIRLFISTGSEHFGVTGVSPLIAFKDFDLINGTIIDYLHCVLEGVSDLLLSRWFDSNNHREKYYITPQRMVTINKNLNKITPFKTFSIKPRSIDEKEYWKAHELKYWLLFYALPCLTGHLKPVYLNHLTLLSEAIFIFLKSRITASEYQKASNNLNKFVTDFQQLYGEESMMHNVHLLKHLPQCVKKCGPLWAYSNFHFESNNGSLVKHVHGSTDVEHQIASKYSFNNSLARLKRSCESTSPTFTYIERMKSMRVKKSEKIGQVTLFGSPHKHKLSSIEESLLQQNSGHVMAYHKFFYGNDIFFSVTYEKAEQTNDTVVILKDQRIGIISLIFIESESVSLLLQMIETERVPNFPSHIKKVCTNKEDRFEKVQAEDVLRKVLFISTVNENFITELPNHYEGD